MCIWGFMSGYKFYGFDFLWEMVMISIFADNKKILNVAKQI